jgi:hypothetical protein
LNALHQILNYDGENIGLFTRTITTPWITGIYDVISGIVIQISPTWTSSDGFKDLFTHHNLLRKTKSMVRLNELYPGLWTLRRFFVGDFPVPHDVVSGQSIGPSTEGLLPPLKAGFVYRIRTFPNTCLSGMVVAVEQVPEVPIHEREETDLSESLYVAIPSSAGSDLSLRIHQTAVQENITDSTSVVDAPNFEVEEPHDVNMVRNFERSQL